MAASARSLSLVGGLMGVLLAVAPARAQDPFEIQVYRADVNLPGHFGLELHSNYVASGLETSQPPELPPNHVLHETLEPSFGITRLWEMGAYLQTALQPDGRFEYAGVKLRTKVRFPLPQSSSFQAAVNVEVSWLPERYDASVWGSEIRPILDWAPGPFVFSLNPIVGFDWRGPHTGIPEIEPAARMRYDFPGLLGIGVEYYADLGPLTHLDPLEDQGHYLYEVLDLLAWPEWEIHFGVGQGLTARSNGLVLKCILGHEF